MQTTEKAMCTQERGTNKETDLFSGDDMGADAHFGERAFPQTGPQDVVPHLLPPLGV